MLNPDALLRLRMLIAREQYLAHLFSPGWEPAFHWWGAWNAARTELATRTVSRRRRAR